MSHDRGCYCGNESWDYRDCVTRKGTECARWNVVYYWDHHRWPPEPIVASPRSLNFWKEPV